MPIKARIDMLSTGIRTPVGVKIFGPTSRRINDIGAQVEAAIASASPARATSSPSA